MKERATRVFVVTDQVIRGTGLVDKVEAGLTDGGLEVAGVFDECPQDSSTAVVDRCAAAAKDAGADSFLALGGGSGVGTPQGGQTGVPPRGPAPAAPGPFLLPRGGGGMGPPPPV